MDTRKLTQAEIDAFPGASSVDVAIKSGGIWYYGDSYPTEEDPAGLADAQFVTDEDGDYIPVRGRGDTFTIGELAQRVTGGNERAIRKMLNDAGADPRLDEYTEAPSETVSRELVIDLFAIRAGDIVGRRLRLVLGETMGGAEHD